MTTFKKFDAGIVPRFRSNWTDQMVDYLLSGIAEHGRQAISDWTEDHMEAIMRSWGDDSKLYHVQWVMDEVFGKDYFDIPA